MSPTPYTLHPTPCILHPTPYTLHPTDHVAHDEVDVALVRQESAVPEVRDRETCQGDNCWLVETRRFLGV
jgi:hypothetical protein